MKSKVTKTLVSEGETQPNIIKKTNPKRKVPIKEISDNKIVVKNHPRSSQKKIKLNASDMLSYENVGLGLDDDKGMDLKAFFNNVKQRVMKFIKSDTRDDF